MPKAIAEGVILGRFDVVRLDDGRRVANLSSLARGWGDQHLNMAPSDDGSSEVVRFIASEPFKSNAVTELAVLQKSPIRYTPRNGGKEAIGHEVEIIPAMIETVLTTFEVTTAPGYRGPALRKNQRRVVEIAQAMRRGLMKVGIAALVDEATGQQAAPGEHADTMRQEMRGALDGLRQELLQGQNGVLQIAVRADERATKAEERCEYTDRVARGLALMLQQGAGDGRLGEQRAKHVNGLITRLAELTGADRQKVNVALRAAMRPAIPQGIKWLEVKVEILPDVLTWLERRIVEAEKTATKNGQGGFQF